jgi:diguanylate cyclase (GGDEF)-like protein
MRALHGERSGFDVTIDTRGASRHLHTVFVADRGADGQVVGLHVLCSDVTTMKTVENQLVEQARVDVLTGLPNRRAFDERLAHALARSRRAEQPMALIFLDIDHFKQINDTYGHGIGDGVLTEFARRLRHSVRLTDTVARLAGDEFVVILESLKARDEAALVARKIAEAIRLPFMLDQLMLQVTSSQGIAYLEGQEVTAADMMSKADSALYDAKRAGRNTYALSSW